MRKSDILLVVLFIVLILGIAFGPELLEQWRARDSAQENAEAPAEPEATVDATDERPQLTPEQAEEAERVGGRLMLYEACVDRFEEFEAESEQIITAWEERHGELLAAQPEQDFRIVLSQPEGLDQAAIEKARAEERALCESNLEAMREELAKSPEDPVPEQ